MARGRTRRQALRVRLMAALLAALVAPGPAAGLGTGEAAVAREAPVAAGAMATDLAAAADLLAAERFDAARAALLALAEQYPGEAGIEAGLGKIAFELRQYKAAVARFERAIALAPEEAGHQFELGRALTGRIAGAGLFKKPGIARRMRAAFEEAVRLDPDHARARLALVSYLANAPGIMGGSKKKAKVQAARLKDIDPATYYRALARLAFADEQKPEALAHYRTSLQLRFEGRTAGEFAALLESEKRWDEALTVLEAAFNHEESGPTPLFVYFLYGRIAAESGRRYVASGQALDHFIAADPRRKSKESMAEAHYLRGRLFEGTDQPAEARRSYEEALQLDKAHKEAGRALKRLDGGG